MMTRLAPSLDNCFLLVSVELYSYLAQDQSVVGKESGLGNLANITVMMIFVVSPLNQGVLALFYVTALLEDISDRDLV